MPNFSSDPRAHLVHALQADLVGPFTLDPTSTETLSLAPTRWYLTGFLAPEHALPSEEAVDDSEIGAGDDEDDADASAPEANPKGPRTFPASIGLSFLLPPAKHARDSITVTLRYAEYVGAPEESPDGKKRAST